MQYGSAPPRIGKYGGGGFKARTATPPKKKIPKIDTPAPAQQDGARGIIGRRRAALKQQPRRARGY